MDFTVLVHHAEEGGFWAEVEELPGCITQGETEAELHANLQEVIELFIECLVDDYVEQLQVRYPNEQPDFVYKMNMTPSKLGTIS